MAVWQINQCGIMKSVLYVVKLKTCFHHVPSRLPCINQQKHKTNVDMKTRHQQLC